jgi:RNA polymerase sigma-70 factor (ECF subfamily)
MEVAEFDAFYLASVHRLVGALYAMTGDLAESQDVVQEAFIRAWDHRAKLDRCNNPEAWVRTVARRLAISRWRRAQTVVVAWQRHGPAPLIEPPDLPDPELAAALRRLPAAQRHAIVLFYLCDQSVEQVAAETGAPIGTVKARLSRGRAALARSLSAMNGTTKERLKEESHGRV